MFVITIAAAEIGLGLAIVLLVFRTNAKVDVEALRDLADRDGEEPAAVEAATTPSDDTQPPATAGSAQVSRSVLAGSPDHPGTAAEVDR